MTAPAPEPAAWLPGQVDAVRGELAKADGKCGTLCAVATAAVAFTVTQAGHGPLAGRVALALSGAAFAAAVLVVLAALRPRFGTHGPFRYARMTAAEIGGLDGPGDTAEVLADLSRLAVVKYRAVRIAVDLASAGVVLLAAGLAAGAMA